MIGDELIDLIKEYPNYKVCYFVHSSGYGGVDVYDLEKDNVNIDYANKIIYLDVNCQQMIERTILKAGGRKVHTKGSYICKKAVKIFGKDLQEMIFIEECGELFQALSKKRRGFKGANIAEEIADVEIALEQLKHIHKCHWEVERWKDKKLMRLCGRIEEYIKKQGLRV